MESKRILVADAEQNVRKLLGLTLEGEGFELLFARTGNEALALALCEKPHLVLLEMVLPGLAGSEVCRLLKSNPATAGAKVIFLTTVTGPDDRDLARRVRADAYVTKPFSPLALLSQVRALLGSGGTQTVERAG